MSTIVENFTNPNDPEYFLIGNVPLPISVEDISINRVQNDDEIMTLRAKYPMVMKTGYSRVDVVVSWKALVGYNPATGEQDFSQLEDVRTIVAIFKGTPFVCVENEHLRKFISPKGYYDSPMAFALRTLRIESCPDIVDGYQITLQMSLFNYMPYSRGMKYRDAGGNPVSALDSTMFADYITAWKTENIDRQPGFKVFQPKPWKEQLSGDQSSVTTFYYRPYAMLGVPMAKDTDPKDPNHKGFMDTQWPSLGWFYDYRMADTQETGVTFMYQEKFFSLSEDYQMSGNQQAFCSGISISMTNNFAIIPLAQYQYPAYQHLGPAVTDVSIAFQVANPDKSTFISDINLAVDTVNKQYLNFRTRSRKVSTTYIMQSIFIENCLLNMLGIYCLQPKNIATQTVDNSDIVQGQIIAIDARPYYEEISGFKVSTAQDAADSAVQLLADPATLGSIDPSDATTLKPLQDFYAAKAAHDTTYFADNGVDFTKNGVSVIGSMPSISLPSGILSSSQIAAFKTIGQSLQNVAVTQASGDWWKKDQKTTANSGLQFIEDCKNTDPTSLTYTDCILIRIVVPESNALSNVDSVTAADYSVGTSKLKAWANTQTPHPMDTMFDTLFAALQTYNPTFSAAVQIAMSSPKFQAAMKKLGTVTPGLNEVNNGHGAYTDLGLSTLDLKGEDFNPAIYFYDDSKDIFNDFTADLQGRIAGILAPAREVNTQYQTPNWATSDPNNGDINKTPVTTMTAAVTSSDPELLQFSKDKGVGGGSAAGVILRSNIPSKSMAEAFPTFKLFLYEEDNTGLFWGFDNFYSYSSVSEIEVIKYQDKPDMAQITLTNLSGLLTHRLFDNSAEGKRDYQDAMEPAMSFTADGEPVTDPTGQSKAIAFNDPEKRSFLAGMGGKRTPLKYYALQTGSKIQVRMGFTNNPDKLFPVFTGQVTDIVEENEVITIQAQSFMLELMQPGADQLRSNGWSPFAAVESVAQILPNIVDDFFHGDFGQIASDWFWGFAPTDSPAYGGGSLTGPTGEADNVIKDLIKCSNARHFGHWQVDQKGDPLSKGFQWTQLDPIPTGTTIGNLISTLYDRSGDNILVNGAFNMDGTSTSGGPQNTVRSWSFETPYCASFFGPSYYVSKEKASGPVWDLIKDVSRRYPEFILAVKPFGFPYGADATLVYAHPNDWYRSRNLLPGETSQPVPNDATDGPAFAAWWVSTGKSQWSSTIHPIALRNPDLSNIDLQKITSGVSPDDDFWNTCSKIDQTKSYEVFSSYLSSLLDRVHNTFFGADEFITRHLGLAYTNTQRDADFNAVQAYIKSAQATIQIANTGGLGTIVADRSLQPVRKYHFVNGDSIISNNMSVNEKIYNAVTVGKDVCIQANEFTPASHTRVLDCNPMINNPEANLEPGGREALRACYAASFLKEEVGKMYRGEIILRGIPEIEPFDIIMLEDISKDIFGPVEVESVIHTFNKDMGFITIVKPRAVILINESFTLNAMANAWMSVTSAWSEKGAIYQEIKQEWTHAPEAAKSVATVDGGITIGGGALALSAAGGGAAVLGAATTGGSYLTGAASLFLEWPLAVVAAATASIAGIGLLVGMNKNNKIMPVIVVPVRKGARPWMGGVEGYRVGDWIQHLGAIYRTFAIENISPLIESYIALKATVFPSIKGVSTPSPAGPTGPSKGVLSPSGLSLLKKFEGLAKIINGKIYAYNDAAGYPTIGYGHLLKSGESYPNGITIQQATDLLAQDAQSAENAVNRLVTVPLTQNQFDALVCFTYNVGTGSSTRHTGLAGSTLLSTLNSGNYSACPALFLTHNTAGGQVISALTNRRQTEANLFSS